MKEHQWFKDYLGQKVNCLYIKDKEYAQAVLDKLSEKECLFALDTETMALPKYRLIKNAALSPHLSKIRLLQVFDGKNAVVFDMMHIDCDGIFLPFLTSKRFVGHNALFDLMFLMRMGVKDINIGCTFILAKLLFHAVYPTDEGLSGSLAALSNKVLGTEMNKALQVSDFTVPELTFEQIEYAALDAVTTLKLAEALAPGLRKFGLERIYTLSKEAQHPIAAMQLNGIGLDVEAHRKSADSWRTQMYAAKKEVLKLTGLPELTPAKIGDYLETALGKKDLIIWPRTDTGRLSTDSDTLSEFSYIPLVKPFSRYQKLSKLTTAFGTKLIQAVSPETGKLHAHYSICGARTGRLSCSSPNLQQLPRDATVRKHFIPETGNVFVCADFSQIELRVGAELSQDSTMLTAYKNGVDLHALTASRVSGKELGDVTKVERQLAKAVNFGLMFGLGARKFSSYARKSYGVEVSSEEASDAVNTFRLMYHGYYDWQMKQVEVCSATKEVRTACGKLRKLPADSIWGNAMNHPVQGSAAEVMLYSLVHVDNAIKEGVIPGKLSNCVHDEILIECTPDRAEDVSKGLELCMIEGFKDVFPKGVTRGLVEAKSGKSWGEAK